MPPLATFTTLLLVLLAPHLDSLAADWAQRGLETPNVPVLVVAWRCTFRFVIAGTIFLLLGYFWVTPVLIAMGLEAPTIAAGTAELAFILVFSAWLWNTTGAFAARVALSEQGAGPAEESSHIETSGSKGTVERISIRSVSLRNPRGAVATVPYGQIVTLLIRGKFMARRQAVRHQESRTRRRTEGVRGKRHQGRCQADHGDERIDAPLTTPAVSWCAGRWTLLASSSGVTSPPEWAMAVASAADPHCSTLAVARMRLRVRC